MEATLTDTTIDANVNESSPRSNRAVPPPIPAAARAKRQVALPLSEIHTVADRDVVCLDDEHPAAPRMLTFPPSPPLPRRERHFDFRLFATIVTLSTASLAAGAGTGWASHARVTSQRVSVPMVIEAKTSHDAVRTSVAPSHRETPATMPRITGASMVSVPTPIAHASTTPAATPRASTPTVPARSARVMLDGVTAPVPELPMPGAVAMAEQRVRGAMIVCGMGVPNAAPTVRADMTYASDGSVRHVALSAPWAGTEPGRCMENALRTRATIPAFRSETFRVTFSFQAQ